MSGPGADDEKEGRDKSAAPGGEADPHAAGALEQMRLDSGITGPVKKPDSDDRPGEIAAADSKLKEAVWRDFFTDAMNNGVNFDQPTIRTPYQIRAVARELLDKYAIRDIDTKLQKLAQERSDLVNTKTTMEAGQAIIDEVIGPNRPLQQDRGSTGEIRLPQELIDHWAPYSVQVNELLRQAAKQCTNMGHDNPIPSQSPVVGQQAVREATRKLIANDPHKSAAENAVKHAVAMRLLITLGKNPDSAPAQLFANVADPHGEAKAQFYNQATEHLMQTLPFTNPGTEQSFADCRNELFKLLDQSTNMQEADRAELRKEIESSLRINNADRTISPIARLQQLHDQIPQVQNEQFARRFQADPQEARALAAKEVLWLANDKDRAIGTNNRVDTELTVAIIDKLASDYLENPKIDKDTADAAAGALRDLKRELHSNVDKERTIEQTLKIASGAWKAVGSGVFATHPAERAELEKEATRLILSPAELTTHSLSEYINSVSSRDALKELSLQGTTIEFSKNTDSMQIVFANQDGQKITPLRQDKSDLVGLDEHGNQVRMDMGQVKKTIVFPEARLGWVNGEDSLTERQGLFEDIHAAIDYISYLGHPDLVNSRPVNLEQFRQDHSAMFLWPDIEDPNKPPFGSELTTKLISDEIIDGMLTTIADKLPKNIDFSTMDTKQAQAVCDSTRAAVLEYLTAKNLTYPAWDRLHITLDTDPAEHDSRMEHFIISEGKEISVKKMGDTFVQTKGGPSIDATTVHTRYIMPTSELNRDFFIESMARELLMYTHSGPRSLEISEAIVNRMDAMFPLDLQIDKGTLVTKLATLLKGLNSGEPDRAPAPLQEPVKIEIKENQLHIGTEHVVTLATIWSERVKQLEQAERTAPDKTSKVEIEKQLKIERQMLDHLSHADPSNPEHIEAVTKASKLMHEATAILRGAPGSAGSHGLSLSEMAEQRGRLTALTMLLKEITTKLLGH